MRKLKLQVQTSIDGYMSGPDNRMDFMTFPWSDDAGAYVFDLMHSVDTILMGRNLATGFIPHWAARPEYEPPESVDWMNNTPKVVVSNSLTESPWENATIANGDLTEIVNTLKAQEGGDLIVYGGGTLVSDLIARGLIDDLHLFVNPNATGGGMPVFPNTGATQRFRLVGAHPFECGMTAMHYEPKRD